MLREQWTVCKQMLVALDGPTEQDEGAAALKFAAERFHHRLRHVLEELRVFRLEPFDAVACSHLVELDQGPRKME